MTNYSDIFNSRTSLSPPVTCPIILFFLVSYVEERSRWPIQSPNKGEEKKVKDCEEREIRSPLLILNLNVGKLWDQGKEEEGKKLKKRHILGMNDERGGE